MTEAKTFSVNRCIFRQCLSQAGSIELHGFGDASVPAYGSCIYIRVDYGDQVNVHLLSSKTRVAPLKPLTIPRKELLSALLTARLINSVKSALEQFIHIKSVNCWLDSSIALHWIKNNQDEYKQFIENRRQEIWKLVEPASFNYCPTGENPADLTSRGLPLSKLKQNSLWLHGPKFLTLPLDQWPRLKCELTADQTFLDTQEKKQKQSSVFSLKSAT